MGNFLNFCWQQLTYKPRPLPESVNLKDQTVLITGANVGLGLATALELASHGVSHLILGVRNVSAGDKAKAQILQKNPSCFVEVWQLDLENFLNIIAFAEKADKLPRLDIALLNAGVKKLEFVKSPLTGHEQQVQVNHLGTALLAFLLIKPLENTARTYRKKSRLTIVSSEVHFWTPFNERKYQSILKRMDEPDSFKPGMERYYTSKLLNVLFTRELAKSVNENEVVINTVNPGFCTSQLHRDDSSAALKVFLKVFAWTETQGGHVLSHAVAGDVEAHGKYLSEQRETP
ncbi:dehydrogenase [Patellaria atrata CBS 101060]|uniref:Dehydrogenase n=1 Tax=Patellaria atrata CBS 101060 TaxID=1346257 RepID=A0A9P4SFP4_9PEZI|nr:dehydrogenase [Patellaria atrata CBS 101060]